MNERGPRPPATTNELESIAGLIQQVFQSDQTTGAHRAMARMPGFDPASLPTVWDDDGHPVATVQAVPCEVALLGQWLPAGIITMVATAEHARGRGYMRRCMDAAHEWLFDNGRPLGILYGVPGIYPKFGYRPLMPRCETRYETPDNAGHVPSRPAGDDDAPTMAALFNAQEHARPCAVKRGTEPWIWQSTHGYSSLWCVDGNGAVDGYFRTVNAGSDDLAMTVIEAACPPLHEAALLDAVHSRARTAGKSAVVLRLPLDHPLVLEATRRATSLQMFGVEQAVIPPQAGMLATLDPEQVLAMLTPVIEQRLDGRSLRIHAGSAVDISFNGEAGATLQLGDPADIAHLLAGYPGVPALHQWERLHADDDSLRLAEQVFPNSWPRWVLAPFWDE